MARKRERQPVRRRSLSHNAVRHLRGERLEDRLLLASDFGDAPSPYPTLIADNGAEHDAVGPSLGPSRNTETDGTPTNESNGDDDDGVQIGEIRVGQFSAVFEVDVHNAPNGAMLDAWIDFDRDGSWSGLGEQIADTVRVENDLNRIVFDVPGWAAGGATFARFRLSSGGNLGVGGFAADGEVEDHMVVISPPAQHSSPNSAHTVIESNVHDTRQILSSDLDLDGDQDVIVLALGDNRIAWFENRAEDSVVDLNLQHVISIGATEFSSIYIADLDNDNDDDLLSADLDGRLSWFENRLNEDPQGFTDPQTIATALGETVDVLAADLDGDGDMDVVGSILADGMGELVWHENRLNSPEGDFAAARSIAADTHTFENAIAVDMDGDGDDDIVVSIGVTNAITWFENQLNESPSQFTLNHQVTVVEDGVYDLDAADLDADGDSDLVFADRGRREVYWMENLTQQGSLAFADRVFAARVIGATPIVDLSDLDNDGDSDIVIRSNGAFYRVENQLNEPEASFADAVTILAPFFWSTAIETTDVDGDGKEDIIANVGHRIHWIKNPLDLETENFVLQPAFSVSAAETVDIFVADLDRDGDGDILSASGDDQIAWYENRGDETHAVFGEMSVIPTSHSYPEAVLATDLDGDGYQDIVVSTGFGVYWHENQWDGVQLAFGEVRLIGASGLSDITAGDLDGDGDTDVVAGNAWYENRLDQGLDFHHHAIDAMLAPKSIHIADVDADGDGDIIALANRNGGYRLSWYENRINEGDDHFTTRVRMTSLESGAELVFVADLDTDGDVDVVTADRIRDRIIWIENEAGTQFTTHFIENVAEYPLGIFAADLDGDHDLDLLSTSRDENEIAWRENRLNENEGDFGEPITITTDALGVRQLFVADIDGDGALDVVSANEQSTSISWYQIRSDFVPPKVVSIERRSPSPANDATVDYRVTFSENVRGVTISDFVLVDLHDSLDGEEVTRVSSSHGSTIDVTVNTGSGDGELRLDLLAGDAEITDDAEMVLETDFRSGASYVVDHSPPYFVPSPDFDVRKDAITAIEFEVSEPIITGLISFDEVTLRRDAVNVALDATVTVTATSASRFLVQGLGPFTAIPGRYELVIQASSVVDVAGNLGDGTFSQDWRMLDQFDYGDAPASYDSASPNAAGHIAEGPRLGDARDAESSEAPTADAVGDGGDEDGVVFSSIRVGLNGTMTVNVQNAPLGATLDAWLDFQRDGTWEGPLDRIATGVAVEDGDTVIAFDVPASAASGITYARVRVSSDGSPGPRGLIEDGEVEDYLVRVDAPSLSGGGFGSLTVFAPDVDNPASPFMSDLDGDGDDDILGISRSSGQVLWWENRLNQAEGDFGRPMIVSDAGDENFVMAADLDGDGDNDPIAHSPLGALSWYENRLGEAEGDFGPPERLLNRSSLDEFHTADLEGDGDIDIFMLRKETPAEIYWLVNRLAEPEADFVIRSQFNSAVHEIKAIRAGDFDGDGDVDIAGSTNLSFFWGENRVRFGGSRSFNLRFMRHSVVFAISQPADFDLDGDLDLVVQSDAGTLGWMENRINETLDFEPVRLFSRRQPQ